MIESKSARWWTIHELMRRLPVSVAFRWCGGENGPCACLGCVNQYGGRIGLTKAEWLEYVKEQRDGLDRILNPSAPVEGEMSLNIECYGEPLDIPTGKKVYVGVDLETGQICLTNVGEGTDYVLRLSVGASRSIAQRVISPPLVPVVKNEVQGPKYEFKGTEWVPRVDVPPKDAP